MPEFIYRVKEGGEKPMDAIINMARSGGRSGWDAGIGRLRGDNEQTWSPSRAIR